MPKLSFPSDSWQSLRQYTAARIALGRAGASLPTSAWLDFKYDHAIARDAVHAEFDAEELAKQMESLGLESRIVSSAAPDRATYLTRPDLGRRLADADVRYLDDCCATSSCDLAIIVSDGLSAAAAHLHAAPLVAALLPSLRQWNWQMAPVVVVRFGRVAIADQIGQWLGARLALILLGERPGLKAADSLGAYLVYDPRPGRTDAQRNCVSNIRPAGLSIAQATDTIMYLLREAHRRGISGIELKDDRPNLASNRSSPKEHKVTFLEQ